MTLKIEERDSWLADVPPDDMRRIVDALYRAHGLHASITDLDGLLHVLMEESKQVACAEACSLLLYDEAAQDLYFQVALGDAGDPEALKAGLRLPLGEGIAGMAAQTRESIMVQDAASDPRVNRTGDAIAQFETRTLLAVPLVDGERLVGVLEVLNKVDGGPFTDFDRRIMEMFSALAASLITRARLIEENIRSERLAAVGQTVAGLSHYTKNIINAMIGSVELIDSGIEGGKPKLWRTAWPILKRSIERLTHVVEDMLAFSTPREPLREPCDVRGMVDEAVQSFRGLFVQKRIDLEVRIADEALNEPLSLDSRGMYRCILNLLTNAADAAPDEGGRIRVSADAADGWLVIEVADNGPGVPEDLKHHIFDAFFSTKGSRGTGLGLAVTQKIAVEQGGAVTVSTSDLGGAAFRIRVPDRPNRPEG